jgi:hypothetical protein
VEDTLQFFGVAVFFDAKLDHLPRQARDKHQESKA